MSTTDELVERLSKIKDKIEESKRLKANYEGRLATEMKNLKLLGCETLEEAYKKLEEYEESIPRLEAKIKDGVVKLEVRLEAIENGVQT